MVDGAHENQAFHNHYDDNSNVFRECHQQSSEVVGFHHTLFAVEG